MAAVKLIRGMSYLGCGVRVSRADPVLHTDGRTAARLIASGFFIAVPDDAENPTPEPHVNRPITVYDTMTVKQLKEAAKEKGIDVTGLRTKAALVNALAATVPEGPDVNPMIVLQEEQ